MDPVQASDRPTVPAVPSARRSLIPRRLVALVCAAALALAVACPGDALAGRHALVFGNGAYEHAEVLRNPANDAEAVAAALRTAGWEVTERRDRGVREMLRDLREFCESAAGSEAALFFFAGHGMEVGGRNYLLPVDAQLREEDDLHLETLALDKVLADLAAARIRLKTVVLDCCRDNPFVATRGWARTRSGGGGLAAVGEEKLPEGTMLVYAGPPGEKVSDGRGRHSPFTEALLGQMRAGSGAPMLAVFAALAEGAGSRTQPWINFDGSGRSLAAFSAYPLVPGRGGGGIRPDPPARETSADRLRVATRDSPFVNTLGLEFVPVPGRRGVWMSRTQTRVRDWRACVQDTGYVQQGGAEVMRFAGRGVINWELDESVSWDRPGFQQTDDHPVVCVSWEEAQGFAEWLSMREPGLLYRLPSDAEWSAAIGSGLRYPWGDEWPAPPTAGNYFGREMVSVLPGRAWPSAFAGNQQDGAVFTAPVASYRENPFGFFDLGGNVWEWCEDWYRSSMNDADVVADLSRRGFDDGGGRRFRVLRGGSWSDFSEMYLRSSARNDGDPATRRVDFGFRLAVEAASR